MKYALLDQNNSLYGLVNLGDYVQSIAARQYLPQVDFYVEREKLNVDCEPAKIIMNSWFTYSPQNWPPHPNLDPLFVSFHLNPVYADELLSNPQNVDYLKKYAPIGCRDYKTQKILDKYGIPNYFSYCLTSTLGLTYKHDGGYSNEIIFSDLLTPYIPLKPEIKWNKNSALAFSSYVYRKLFKSKKRDKLLRNLLPESVLNQAIEFTHILSSQYSTDELFKKAHNALIKYSKAKLVITSRIHCALPCLAMGTPVLFVLDGIKDPNSDLSRLNGIINYMNILTTLPKKHFYDIFGSEINVFHKEEIDWNNLPKNPILFNKHRDNLIEVCREFINK